MVPVFASLPKATPQMIGLLIVPIIIVVFIISLFGITVISLLLGKILGYSWRMSIAVGVTCLFGFPATSIIAEEVSVAVSNNATEARLSVKHYPS